MDGEDVEMKIRKAEILDRDRLIELMQRADNRTQEWAEEKVRGFVLKGRNKRILVAEDDGNLVGFIGLKEYEDNPARQFVDLTKFAWITWIAVLPEHRNKRIGSDLLRFAELSIDDYNKEGLILDCRQKITPFYIKNGYKFAGEYFDKEFPRYVMIKNLK